VLRTRSLLTSAFVIAAGCHTTDLVAVGSEEDAATADAGSVADAGRTGNVLLNPGCEEGTTAWDAWQGTLSTTSPGHSGAAACLVCTVAGSTESSLDARQGDNDVSMPPLGSSWRARAWVRVPTGGGSTEAELLIREWPAVDRSGDTSAGGPVTIDDAAWTPLDVTHTVTGADDWILDVYVVQRGASGDCFLVDDVYLGAL
jgi:hypothetical protein